MANAKKVQETTEATDVVVKVNPLTEAYKMPELTEKYKTKSAIIRFLTSEGHTRSHIAKFMGIRYQHVRNVQVADAEKAEA